MQSERCSILSKQPVIVVNIFPGMPPEILDVSAQEGEVLLLEGNAHGGIANALIPTVRRIIEDGTPVIILTDNAQAGHGVLRIVDQPQQAALAVGCIYLEKANVIHTPKVIAAIQNDIASGMTGEQSAKHIQRMFAYDSDAQKPVSPLGTEEGLQTFRDNANKEIEDLLFG